MIQETTLPNLAFLGVGWIGKNRMDAIIKSKTGTPIIIADSQTQLIEKIKSEYSDSRFCTSLNEIIDSNDIQGIVIATPSALHAEQAIAVLNKGIPLFCQKPLGRNLKETKDVVSTAKKMNRLLGVDMSYRYTKAFEMIKDAVESGEIGDVFAADLVFHNAYGPDKPWSYNYELSGGGCVIDLGIHLADMALLILGFPEIKKVSSSIYSKGKLISPKDKIAEDYAEAIVSFSNGAAVRISCSWEISAGQNAIIEARFYGTKGGAAFKNLYGSFYDFTAELYHGTQKNVLCMPPDEWSGRAAVEWSRQLASDNTFNENAEDYIKTAELIDMIYGREIE